jgi:hypothetical protein
VRFALPQRIVSDYATYFGLRGGEIRQELTATKTGCDRQHASVCGNSFGSAIHLFGTAFPIAFCRFAFGLIHDLKVPSEIG